MKRLLVILIVVAVVAAIAVGAYLLLTRQEPLEARPPGTDGSARWAYDAARPRAQSELASDAVPVEVTGEDVMPDGRLAANRGKWTIAFSSFTAGERVNISVDHLGGVTVGERSSPGVIRALGTPPGNFTDSITVFANTAGHGAAGARTVENPVTCVYDNIAGNHVWTIRYRVDSTTETHKVRADGLWLSVN